MVRPSRRNGRALFHTSAASSQSSAQNSGKGIAMDSRMGTSGHSGASTTSNQSKRGIGRAGRRIISKAAQSTRKLIGPSKSKSSSRNRRTPSFDEYETTSAPSFSPPSSFPSKPSALKTRYVSAPQATIARMPLMESGEDENSTGISRAEPRRHFSKWNKIKNNLKNSEAKGKNNGRRKDPPSNGRRKDPPSNGRRKDPPSTVKSPRS